MRRALIGYSGFVGSNLDRQQEFSARYNSRNFRDMQGESFDEVVCAGVQAVKWWANQNRAEDKAAIAALLDVLSTVRARRFVLISTVDVYREPVGVDETTEVATDGLHAYGLHRWQAEEWVRARHREHIIVRLPGLYGPGLKKNLIFDLLEGRSVEGFDARSSFQFYNLNRLGGDIETAQKAGLKTVNLAVEPVDVASVALALTGREYANRTDGPPQRYDMRTVHAGVWGHDGGYLESGAESLAGIAAFAQNWRQERSA